jgi:AmmeMemoRadiSam system protein B
MASRALEHRYDHEREHSIELQVPWIQHCIGAGPDGRHVPVLGILVHDPAVNHGESYDGKGLGLTPFVEALSLALQDVGGRTLLVSSADLSHVGPMFGDAQPMAGDEGPAAQARQRLITHDHELINLILWCKPDELVARMYWQQNPTRWCSTGNIVATLMVAKPASAKTLRYVAAMDPEGMGIVTSAAIVMNGPE